MKWKVMLCEQFFEVEAETEEDALGKAAATFTPQCTPDDFIVLGAADTSTERS